MLEVTMPVSTEALVLSDGKLWELTGVGMEDTTDLTRVAVLSVEGTGQSWVPMMETG